MDGTVTERCSSADEHARPWQSDALAIRTRLAMATLLSACFGPYLAEGFGLRTEQVVVYLLAVPASLAVLSKNKLPIPMFAGGLSWLGLLVVGMIAGLFAPDVGLTNAGLAFIGGADNLLLPLAAGVVAWEWQARRHTTKQLILHYLCRVYLLLLALNTLVIVVSFVHELPGLRMWWSASEGQVVGDRAMALGRLSGIFNQPLEGGIAYSIGLLMLVYLSHTARTWRHGPLYAAILLGGFATISKIFFLIGIPLAAAYLAYISRFRLRRLLVGAGSTSLCVAFLFWEKIPWDGAQRLRSNLWSFGGGDRGLISLYSAGRYGESGGLQRAVTRVLEESPLTGFGLPGLPPPYDSAYVESFVVGGVIGIALYIIAIGMFGVRWFQLRYVLGSSERGLLLALLALVAGAGFGGPTITANRTGVVLITLLVVGLGPSGSGDDMSKRGVRCRNGAAEHGVFRRVDMNRR